MFFAQRLSLNPTSCLPGLICSASWILAFSFPALSCGTSGSSAPFPYPGSLRSHTFRPTFACYSGTNHTHRYPAYILSQIQVYLGKPGPLYLPEEKVPFCSKADKVDQG